jgi:hypothetical protein
MARAELENWSGLKKRNRPQMNTDARGRVPAAVIHRAVMVVTSDMPDRHGILRELQAGIAREWASDFAQLRRIPSTHVRKYLDYVAGLDAPGKRAFAAAMAEGAFDFLFPDQCTVPLYKRNPAYRKYADAAVHITGQRYSSIRALRDTLALANAEPVPPPARPRRLRMALANPPPEPMLSAKERQWICAIRPVTPSDIRKQVKQSLSRLVSSLSITHSPGRLWEYSGAIDGVPAVISVHYASPHDQLQYWVSIRNQRPGFWGSNFERLVGLTGSDWDLLEGANLEQSAALLCEHISYCAGFLRRLPII